ncbi:spore coat associated protein CotJA [Massilibacterium senegalense]
MNSSSKKPVHSDHFSPQFPLFEAIQKGTLFKKLYHPYIEKRGNDN